MMWPEIGWAEVTHMNLSEAEKDFEINVGEI